MKAADAGSLEGKLCPVGGAPVMEKVADILGLEAVAAEPKVAVVRCNGSCENRPRTCLLYTSRTKDSLRKQCPNRSVRLTLPIR